MAQPESAVLVLFHDEGSAHLFADTAIGALPAVLARAPVNADSADRRHQDRSSIMAAVFSGIRIPDSRIAREAAELVRQHQTEMLFNHSVRVFVFGAMKGIRQNLKFDSELLYVAALFHDLGLANAYHTDTKRFEVDGADAAREFLRSQAERVHADPQYALAKLTENRAAKASWLSLHRRQLAGSGRASAPRRELLLWAIARSAC